MSRHLFYKKMVMVNVLYSLLQNSRIFLSEANRLTIGARYHIEGVGSRPTKHAKISEIVGSRHEQHYVDDDDEAQKGEELLVIAPVIDSELVGH